MRRAVALILLAGGVLAHTAVARAQTPPPNNTAAAVAFDVASIKLNTSGSGRSSSSMPPEGLFRGVNLTLRQLIVYAYELRPFQIVGGPGWLDGDHFDVLARTPDGAPRNMMPAMLRELLGERFGLAVHVETREESVYALLPARGDRRLGPKLTVSECSGTECGMNTSMSNGAGTLKGTGRSMSDLAVWVANSVDRVVIDRTGMPDRYDFELRFTRDDVRPGAAGPPADAPSIFTALQEQLGLKLESAKGPVEFLVVDRVTRPTPD